jgi:hypothetical protein
LFAGHEVTDLVVGSDRAAKHQPRGAGLPLVLLPADLAQAGAVLIEGRVIRERYQSHLERDPALLDLRLVNHGLRHVGDQKWFLRRGERLGFKFAKRRSRLGFLRLRARGGRAQQTRRQPAGQRDGDEVLPAAPSCRAKATERRRKRSEGGSAGGFHGCDFQSLNRSKRR